MGELYALASTDCSAALAPQPGPRQPGATAAAAAAGPAVQRQGASDHGAYYGASLIAIPAGRHLAELGGSNGGNASAVQASDEAASPPPSLLTPPPPSPSLPPPPPPPQPLHAAGRRTSQAASPALRPVLLR